MDEDTEFLTIDQLAPLIARKTATIRTQLTRAPHLLPPRAPIPGVRHVLWFKADVIQWLDSFRQLRGSNDASSRAPTTMRRGRGRPKKMVAA